MIFFQAADIYNASLQPTYTQGERSGSAGGTTQNNSASEVLSDPTYQRVVNGWNQKLRASSEDLSGLVPFCELYAIFDDNDLIYQEENSRYTAIKNRLFDVKFVGARENIKAPLPEGISENCKIAKIAGENISQISPDSINDRGNDQYDPYSSFKGIPGISDLSVSRGSGGGAQNVKYDLTLTMPNPEIINEKFEYSKLMLMNSAFLLIYGWNIKDSNFDVDYYPPDITKGANNIIPVGSGVGGFWSSAVISLYNFQFDFDTVGHLVGKLSFLNASGILLGSLQVEAVGDTMFSSLSKPSRSVLDRVNNNQNFIWQNGVPWSATDGNKELAENASDEASKSSIVRDYFGNDQATWTIASEKHIGGAGFTPAAAAALREDISALRVMGEDFLIKFRKKLINKLFERKRAGTLTTGETKTMEELEESSNIKDLGMETNYIRLGLPKEEQKKENGRTYKGSDVIDQAIDVYYAGNIKNAWNDFFMLRFEGMSNPRNAGNSSNIIPMLLLDEDEPQDIPVGSTYADFRVLAVVPPGIIEPVEWKVSFIEREYARGDLVPKAFEDIMRSTPTAPSTEAYIRDMPPFGKELQRLTVEEFGKEGNLNYNLLSARGPLIDPRVSKLIHSTSVISVPVPISNQDVAILSIEERPYSEIMEKAPQEVIISFEFLNALSNISGDAIPDTLHKIKFHNTSVLISLQSMDGMESVNAAGETVNFVKQLIEDWPNDPNIGVEIGAGSEGFLFRDNLSDSFNPNAIGQGRFVQWKYAVLKNGYVVKQYKDNISKQTFIDLQPPQLAVTQDGRPGLSFLNDLLPFEMATAAGTLGDKNTGDDKEEYGDVKTWAQIIDEHRGIYESNLYGKEKIKSDTSGEYVDRIDWMQEEGKTVAQILVAREQIEAAQTLLNNFNILASLEDSIAGAIQGGQALNREAMHTANEDEVAIQDGEGDTTHTIFRQPVYFFLGAVLESLRITTNNRIKFHYSKIPQRKVGESFHISIPESTGNSIEASYDSQIAHLTSELAILHAGGIDNEEVEITLIVDDTPPTDREAAELEQRQKAWDDRLVAYIKGRGQDFATLGYNDRGIPGNLNNSEIDIDSPKRAQQQGVYHSYTNSNGTNWISDPASPAALYSAETGYDGIELSQDWNDNIIPNRIWIRPPWIYRIGSVEENGSGFVDKYYGSHFWPSGGEYRTGMATEFGWATWNSGDGQFKWKNSFRGFMRLWRPEDLSAALRLLAEGNDSFYHRTPPSNSERGHYPVDHFTYEGPGKVSGFPSFITDSFGEGNLAIPKDQADADKGVTVISPAMPDYGLQSMAAGNPSAYSAGGYKVTKVSDGDAIIKKLTSWLNWYPVESVDPGSPIEHSPEYMRRYRNLGNQRHVGQLIVAGDSNPNYISSRTDETTQKVVPAQDHAAEFNWYKIDWESGGGRNQHDPQGAAGYTASTRMKVPFWVKGIVVDDFVHMEGQRPTVLYPLPLQGESAGDTRVRYQKIAELRNRLNKLQELKKQADVKTQFRNLPIRSTYEIPLYIDTIKGFLTSEPRAPLHNLLKKILGAAKETLPAVQLSMRPVPSDPAYIDIFPSAMNYDGVIQEVFTEVDVNTRIALGTVIGDDPYSSDILTARRNINYGGLVTSEKVIVCQFGTAQNLVENFGLNSKIDPTAFSAFRLPAVVGGANMNLTEILRFTRDNNAPAYASLMGDFGEILNRGLTTGMDGLKDLKIVSESDDGLVLDETNLNNFLLSENVPAISKAATGFLEDMMSQDVAVYNKILIMQNQYFTGLEPNMEGFTGEVDKNTRLPGSKFYGNVLSTFLRTANLTIHGTTGLNVFNLIYLKGLLSGVEGLYLISSVNESIAASTFTTTLECKLIEYVNNNSKTNPLAYRGDADLNRLGSIIDEHAREEDIEFGVDYTIEQLDSFIERSDRNLGFID